MCAMSGKQGCIGIDKRLSLGWSFNEVLRETRSTLFVLLQKRVKRLESPNERGRENWTSSVVSVFSALAKFNRLPLKSIKTLTQRNHRLTE